MRKPVVFLRLNGTNNGKQTATEALHGNGQQQA